MVDGRWGWPTYYYSQQMSYEIGVDIVETERIRAAIAKDGDKFVKRLFSEWEIDYCGAKPEPAQHYAARFAAKEAVVKAFGNASEEEGWRWPEVEVRNDDYGKPQIKLYGEAEKQARDMGAKAIKLTLSHSREHAVAFVLVEIER